MSEHMTYAGTSVNYGAMDPKKRQGQVAARSTAGNLKRFGYEEYEPSRGESCYLMEGADHFLGKVIEGLGTKNKVRENGALKLANTVEHLQGARLHGGIAQDNVAMIVNDMITVGCLPMAFALHLACGVDWLKDDVLYSQFIQSTADACMLARCTWGPGETSTLVDVVYPDSSAIGGSAMGMLRPKSRLMIGSKIRPGDVIVFLASIGIHANGLTLARRIADKLPKGYLTEVAGRTYGETLLDPTHIYVGFIEDCLDAGIDLHYGVNITGHGLRKLMRAEQNFAYVIDRLPPVPPIFGFIEEHGPVERREMFANLNMGAGFALILPEAEVPQLKAVHARTNPPYSLTIGGYVAPDAPGKKRVAINAEGLGIEFAGEELAVR
jgi:phosphoribosylformylglycinamidine cyclo-ligase